MRGNSSPSSCLPNPLRPTTSPLWAKVHGEDRLALPSAPEYTGVLTEMGVDFQVQRLPPWGPEPFADMETAVNECSARLFLEPDSEKADLLNAALLESLTEVDGGLGFHWAAPSTPWLIRWTPQLGGRHQSAGRDR